MRPVKKPGGRDMPIRGRFIGSTLALFLVGLSACAVLAQEDGGPRARGKQLFTDQG